MCCWKFCAITTNGSAPEVIDADRPIMVGETPVRARRCFRTATLFGSMSDSSCAVFDESSKKNVISFGRSKWWT